MARQITDLIIKSNQAKGSEHFDSFKDYLETIFEKLPAISELEENSKCYFCDEPASVFITVNDLVRNMCSKCFIEKIT
jgi:hypothetical protein